jgi:GxxExxY protein
MSRPNFGANQYPHSDLTGRIIKACQTVHRYFGPGLPEAVYHRALGIELGLGGLSHSLEPELGVVYREGTLVGKFIPDIVVENKVLVEIKALSALTDEHVAQVLTYLKVTNLQVGLLVNFGEKSLAVRRLINAHHDPTRPSLPLK